MKVLALRGCALVPAQTTNEEGKGAGTRTRVAGLRARWTSDTTLAWPRERHHAPRLSLVGRRIRGAAALVETATKGPILVVRSCTSREQTVVHSEFRPESQRGFCVEPVQDASLVLRC